jgi:hypothetical protein
VSARRGCLHWITTSQIRSCRCWPASKTDAELVRIDQIHSGMPDLDDWELLIALHQHSETWDGLITTDSSMLNQGPELAS